MIPRRKFHPDLMETSGRDDFQQRNASLKARIANLRCMRIRNIILEKAKRKFRIHRPGTQQNRGPVTTAKTNRSINQPQHKSSRKKAVAKINRSKKTAAMSCKHNIAAPNSFRLAFAAEFKAILISPLQPAHHNQPCRC